MRLTLLTALLLPAAMVAQQLSTAPATVKPTNASGQGAINWLSLEQAQQLSKRDGKPIMVDVYTSWCGPCKMLTSKTFTDKQLSDYVNKNYHAVKFDAEGPDAVKFNGQSYTNPEYRPEMKGMRNGTHQLTMQIAPVNGRVAYPTVVYLDADGKVLAPVQGYLTPEQMEPILIYFGEGVHKGQEYQSWYPTFKSRRN